MCTSLYIIFGAQIYVKLRVTVEKVTPILYRSSIGHFDLLHWKLKLETHCQRLTGDNSVYQRLADATSLASPVWLRILTPQRRRSYSTKVHPNLTECCCMIPSLPSCLIGHGEQKLGA
ncbi:hypothetical protein KL935_004683 [Ogataea polymorpha]|nr:hypothetical protein KL935_004683 [Ogataea polymorpha]KAG7906122.1 hypothetical protein KL906_004901 [Ogataea polymorpha]